MKPPRAILLDVGDTILRQHWFDLSVGIDAVVHDRARSEVLTSEFRGYELPAYARGDECRLAEWLRLQVPSLASQPTDAIEDRIWAAVVRMEPLPGIEPVLKKLADDQLPVGAVSNAAFSGRAIRAELARHDLAARFRFVLSSADLRIRKPSPGIYTAALDRGEDLVGHSGEDGAGHRLVGGQRREHGALLTADPAQPHQPDQRHRPARVAPCPDPPQNLAAGVHRGTITQNRLPAAGAEDEPIRRRPR